jgi:transposase
VAHTGGITAGYSLAKWAKQMGSALGDKAGEDFGDFANGVLKRRPRGVATLTNLRVLQHKFSRLRLIWADGAYVGELLAWLWSLRPWRKVRLKIVRRSDTAKGFQVLLKCWIVERTLGWFGRYRRLRSARGVLEAARCRKKARPSKFPCCATTRCST